MKKILLIITALFFTFGAVAQDSKGTDFWIAVPGNLTTNSPVAELYITAEVATNVTVTIPGLAFSQVVAIAAGALQTVVLPSTVQIQSSGISNLGVHVSSTAEVTVYCMNKRDASTDAYMALPVDALGTEHYVMGYSPDLDFSIPAQLTVVATEDNTTVTINPTAANTEGLTVGANNNVVLDSGETYQIRSTVYTVAGDFTGSKVSSDKPIAVFGGNQCTNISGSFRACDHLVEQIPPNTAWGVSFVTVPLATRTAGDVFRILAQTNGTSVSINGAVVAALNAGEFYETILASTTYNRITATEPILVGQFSRSSQTDGVTSDPFFALVPPDDQFLTEYIISSGTANIPNNYLNITSPTANTASVLVDGAGVNPALWNVIPGTTFSGAKVPATSGVHTVSSTLPVGVLAYGFGSFDSYGYLGGQSFSPVGVVDSLKLDLVQVATFQAQEKCLQAKVLDQNNDPVVGVKVDFNIFGANTISGFDFTDATGAIVFCYNVCLAGTDTVVASIAGLTDTAYIVIQPTTLSATPLLSVINVGDLHCVTATIKDGANVPVENAVVTFTLTGANAGNQAILTDVNGEATFCYTATFDGLDTIDIAAGCTNGNSVEAHITVLDNNPPPPPPTPCQLNPVTMSFTPYGLNSIWTNQGLTDPNTFYFGVTQWKRIRATVSGGVGPFTYNWSSSHGYTMKPWGANPLRTSLFEPLTSSYVILEVTDQGNGNCVTKDSIYIPLDSSYYCGTPQNFWMLKVCQGGVTQCVPWGTAKSLISNNLATLGDCPVPKNALVNNDIIIFPNPSNGVVSVKWPSEIHSNATIEITDVNGRRLHFENVQLAEGENYHHLLLEDLPNGMYFIRLVNKNQVVVQNLTIQR